MTMSTPFTSKLGAKAANSLREKRRVSSKNQSQDEVEVVEVDTEAHENNGSPPKVYSFFDPADVNKRNNSHDQSVDNNSGAFIDDAASTATERIGNHKSLSQDSSNSARPFISSVVIEEEVKEVKYEDGATDLFMLVEDAKWEEVCDRVEEEPSGARTWVASSGTENSVFSWSVWRRLPLHEACRRQPPPIVIYTLLAAYPEACMAESNFGELPLHAAVRCGACAEVVNCLIASYPRAVLAKDNSSCTPLDILNGTGKMLDHDAVVAALNRTIAVLEREEQEWEEKMAFLQVEYKQSKDKRRKDYERVVANKNAEIEDLKVALDQENLATSSLAAKVIQTEQLVQDSGKIENRQQEIIKQADTEMMELKSSNANRKSKIKELEGIVRSDQKTIMELNNRVKILQSSHIALLKEEETFAETKLADAEKNFKKLVESQHSFLRETEKRKSSLRNRVDQLGIKIPPPKMTLMEAEEYKKKQKAKKEADEAVMRAEEANVCDNEVAEKALASAMAHLSPGLGDDTDDDTFISLE